MEDTKEVENGLTLGEVFKIILKRIWWVLGATLVCLAVMLMVTQLWYNKREQYYAISYDIVYPEMNGGKYPDGSDLIISDSISLETLTDIKGGKYSNDNPDEFKGVDVNDMHANDGISVSDKVVRSEDGGVKLSCTLSVKAKYFGSVSQARAFLRTVAEYPVNRINAIIADKEYSANLVGYNDAPSYEEKLSALTAQKNYLESEYSKLGAYGEKADAGKASLRNIFTGEQQSDIRAHITAGKYVLDTDVYLEKADAQIAALQLQVEINNKVIKTLRDEQANANGETTPPAVTDPYDERIASLAHQNGELLTRIETIEETVKEIAKYTDKGTDEYAAKQAFDKRLDDFRVQLEEAAENLKTVSVSIYGDNSRVVFSNNKLEKEGGIHWLISAVLGALVGFVVSAIVVYFVGVSKYKREKLAAAQGSGESSAESEAPVADETAE